VHHDPAECETDLESPDRVLDVAIPHIGGPGLEGFLGRSIGGRLALALVIRSPRTTLCSAFVVLVAAFGGVARADPKRDAFGEREGIVCACRATSSCRIVRSGSRRRSPASIPRLETSAPSFASSASR
jgi:hypothetical protein